MRTRRWILLPLIAAFPLAACEPREAEQAPEAEEITPAPMPPADVAPPADEAFADREIEVTNPMPHPMIVTATLDGETVQLGTVPANSTEDFTVQARSGATVELEARDEPDTHRVQGAVTVGDTPAEWTIQQ